MSEERTYLLFTDNFSLAYVEILLYNGRLIQLFGEQTMLVILPLGVKQKDLLFSSISRPDQIDEDGKEALDKWAAWDQSFLPLYSAGM